MGKYWRCGLAAVALAFGAHSALGQPVNGCPAGQAMQSSDPSGKNVTCVPIPDTAGLQQSIANEAAARQAQDANLSTMIGAEAAARGAADGALQGGINAEAAARQAADQALGARIDALGAGETDIVGTWAVVGTTNCLQSSTGFVPDTMSPIIPGVGAGNAFVSQLSGTFSGTRTFNGGGSGHSVGLSHTMTFPGMFFGTNLIQQNPPPAPPTPVTFAGVSTNPGGASLATLDGNFTWSIQPDGTLLITDPASIPQAFTAPPVRVGFTVTIDNRPAYVGRISKDRRTIVLTHPGMAVETSTTRDPNNQVVNSTQRFCARHRVLTRLPD